MTDIVDKSIQSEGPFGPSMIESGVAGVPSASTLGLSSHSTIGLSQAEEVSESLNISVPFIPPPSFQDPVFSSFSKAALSSVSFSPDLAMNKTCLDMLEKWSDSIKQLAEERRNHERTPQFKAEEERRLALQGAIEATGAAANIETSSFTPVLTVGLVFASGGGVIDAMMLDTLSTSMVGVNPTKNGAPLPPESPDLRAELGLIGAAFLQGLFTQAQLSTLGIEAGAPSERESKTAKSFAEGVKTLLASAELRLVIQALVLSRVDKGEAANSMIERMTRKVSIMLLASALAALYKADKEGGTGHITPEEFFGLVQGKNKTFGPNKGLMDELLVPLQEQLKLLSPQEGERMVAVLWQFMQTNPSLKTLTNPKEIFNQMASLGRQRSSEERL